MIVPLLLLVILVVVVVVVSRRAGTHGGRPADGHTVREFFQYLLLFGLLVVVGIGLAGLLARMLGAGQILVADEAQLARSLAFTVVGVPIYAAVALWTRRSFAADPGEARSFGWAFYSTVATLTALVVAMTSGAQVLAWVVGLEAYDSSALATFLVWGALWAAHWWVDRRVTPADRAQTHHLVGSLIGLGFAATGLGGLLAGALRILLGLDGTDLLVEGDDPLRQGLVTLLVGAPVWALYWLAMALRGRRDLHWVAYVLLAGVAGGLVTAVVAASTLLYTVLVWLVGDPASAAAADHFADAPAAAGATAVGVLVWAYHRAVLGQAGAEGRTEVRRVYDYLMAGIGLAAAAVGLATVIVALIEAIAGSGDVLVGGTSTGNTLLAAATLLLVGAPVWWLYWRAAQAAATAEPTTELLSPTRRVYLFVLFGVGGVAAVIALLVGVYLLFEDVVNGTLGLETLRRMRFSLGVLAATGAVAGYHLAVYRSDRERAPAQSGAAGPRHVVLVGPRDPAIASALAHRTHARVQLWARTDEPEASWSVDAVADALAGASSDEVVVVSEAGGLRVIPVRRG